MVLTCHTHPVLFAKLNYVKNGKLNLARTVRRHDKLELEEGRVILEY